MVITRVQVRKSSWVGGTTNLLSGTSLHSGRHANACCLLECFCFHTGRALKFVRSSPSNLEENVACSILEGASLS